MLKKTVDVNLLGDSLSELLSVIHNEIEVTLTRNGVPVAKILPFPSTTDEKISTNKEILKPRTPGGWQGQIWMSDDFDDESPEINAMFYGEDE